MNVQLSLIKHKRLFVAMLAACLLLPASADVVHTLDHDPAGGRFTLEADAEQAALTDADGKVTPIKLADIDEVRFGEDLVVVRSGNKLLINNDRGQAMTRASGKIKLRKGLHRFVVPYWQGEREFGLRLQAAGPGTRGEVELNGDWMRCFRDADEAFEDSPGIDDEGFRLPELALKAGDDRRRFLSRARYRFYVGDESMPFTNMGVLGRLKLKRSGTTSAINTGMVQDPNKHIGIVFEGFFRATEDGEYSFALTSDDGSQLYFGRVDRFKADSLGGTDEGPTPWRAELKPGGEARGDVASIADDALTMNLALGGEAPTQAAIALTHLRALWDTRLTADQFNRDNEPGDQDTVYIRDKDEPDQIRSVSGRILGLTDEALTFVFRDKERSISRDRVVGLVLKHAERPAPPKPGFHQTLRFRTGQVLAGKLISVGDSVVFEMLGGGRVEVPRDALIALRSENGRRIDLTRTEPTAEEAIPYFGLAMPSVVNRSFSGGDIRLFDQNTYARGIAVHSKSRLHYKLERPADVFRARFGLMDPGGRLGDVTARVLGDGEVIWQQANINAKTGVIDVEVDLTGVKRLVLEVDFGEGQNVGDRAAWCDPQIIFADSE